MKALFVGRGSGDGVAGGDGDLGGTSLRQARGVVWCVCSVRSDGPSSGRLSLSLESRRRFSITPTPGFIFLLIHELL